MPEIIKIKYPEIEKCTYGTKDDYCLCLTCKRWIINDCKGGCVSLLDENIKNEEIEYNKPCEITSCPQYIATYTDPSNNNFIT